MQKYFRHPLPLPSHLAKGHWLLSDCQCIKSERSHERLKREKLLTSTRSDALPLGLREHSFNNFKVSELNREAYETCQAFMRNFAKVQQGEGLLLLGRSGTGKTHLASSIANGLKDKHTVAFAYVPILLEKMRTSNVNLDELLSADLLILDDIGSERETGWTMERMLIIVDGRLTNLKPTVFTTNYDLNDLDKRLGMRVASRILGHNLAVVLKGLDYRLNRQRGKNPN